MTNHFETLSQKQVDFSKKKEEGKFEDLVLENCYNQGCEIINRDDFVHQSLLEIKEHDLNTFMHSLEVGNMMAFLINRLGDKLKAEEKTTLMMSALLHDYGKTSIDAEILNKRGDLTDEEHKIIETHPRASYDALKDWNSWVAKVSVAHHEHQGHSYPREKIVEDILDKRDGSQNVRKLSRILAIVDSFQAMTDPTRPSNRSHPKKVDEIVKELGSKKFILSEDQEILFLLEDYYYQNHNKDHQAIDADKQVSNA